MSRPRLLDPRVAPVDWPPGQDMAQAYVEAFARLGSEALISNLRTRVMAIASQDRLQPLSVNDGEIGDAYVCLHSAYALYAKAELDLVDVGPAKPLLAMAADITGLAMRSARLNHVVHLNNWMLSTNLHGTWSGEDLPDIRGLLTNRFPGHVLALRSLTEWSDAALMAEARADGWILLPAREVLVTDDLDRDWRPRRDTLRDLKLLNREGVIRDRLEQLSPGDAARISELYGLLYLDRYSRLNPDFTPAYVELTHQIGLIRYEGLRGPDGRLSAFVGYYSHGDVLTAPLVGYDTSRPAKEGLYRMACALFALAAERGGFRLNGSAGARTFKLNRGARPVIEYTAYYVDHLPLTTRLVLIGMQKALERLTDWMAQETRS